MSPRSRISAIVSSNDDQNYENKIQAGINQNYPLIHLKRKYHSLTLKCKGGDSHMLMCVAKVKQAVLYVPLMHFLSSFNEFSKGFHHSVVVRFHVSDYSISSAHWRLINKLYQKHRDQKNWSYRDFRQQ